MYLFFFKQKTAYEMRISDWSSDVCSSDLAAKLKKPVTLRLSEDVVAYFKGMADDAGVPYQSLINLYLRDCIANHRKIQIKWPDAACPVAIDHDQRSKKDRTCCSIGIKNCSASLSSERH